MWPSLSETTPVTASREVIIRSGAPAPLRMLLVGLLAVAAPAMDLAEALATAQAKRVAESPRWRALLHLGPSWRGERSVVDDRAFFLAPQGATDPQAELTADLTALLTPPVPGETPFIDRFPARSRFLCEALGIPRAALPVPRAAACEDALTSFAPRSATLVFASGYLGAPASMFGHTLLVVKGRYDSLALAQAINYAAATDTNSGVVFAARGIFGGYQGFFSLLPYHRKIGEYADLDQRDLWEYDLALDADELRWLLLHVWELRGIGSDYYFFDENCSWRLLFLLDVARPGLALHARWRPWVIPVDSLRWILDAGLVTTRRHRPSRRTRVLAELEALEPAARTRTKALAEGTADPAASTEARELEAAADLLQSRLAKGGVGLEDYRTRLLGITRARAQLPTLEPVPVPAPAPPEQGHASARVDVVAGQDHGRPFGALRMRPAFHDLTDPEAGYEPGTRIDFAQVELRTYAYVPLSLHRVDAVAIASLAPPDHLGWKPSYLLGTGVVAEPRRQDPDAWRRRSWLDGASGFTVGSGSLQAALLAAAELRVGPDAPAVTLGLGPTLLLRTTPVPALRLLGVVEVHPGVAGERVGHGRAGISAAWSLNRSWSLLANAERRRTWGVDSGEWSGGIRWYW